MSIRTLRVRRVSLLLAAALALRALIPAGFMPAGVGSGSLLMLCPDGLPAAFLAVVPTDHHHHGAHAGDDTAPSAIDDCPLGHLLSSAAATGSGVQAMPASTTACVPAATDSGRFEQFISPYRTRAPPAHSSV